MLPQTAGAEGAIVFGDFRIDHHRRRVFRQRQEIDLTACEYKVLEHLTLHPGRIVTKEELIEMLYGGDVCRDSNLIEVFICRLRRKLDPQGNLNPIITVRGRGYRTNH